MPETERAQDSGSATRQRDRRRGLADVVATVIKAAAEPASDAMRVAFEGVLRQMLPVRTVSLRDSYARWSPQAAAGAVESYAVEVPGVDRASGGVLEASFEPSHSLGDWDFQLLDSAAQLGALLLEIDRGRQRLARATGQGSRPARRERDGAAPLIGATAAMADLRSRIERVAGTDFTILLEGESGVGKELVARQIHEISRRRHGPFVAINCAALVETLLEAELFGIEERTATGVRGRRGKFEHADGGTLFLDEVSDLSLSAQAKLLRAIQDLAVERVGGTGAQRVDIRIVAATNRPLADLVERRAFRADLFYRLSGVDIRVPALRERRSDILELAGYFLERHRSTRALALSAEARDALLTYDWPGNVRELERMMERAVALASGSRIELDDLPPAVRGDYATRVMPSVERNDTLRAWASRYVRLTVTRCGGNKRKASGLLGISYHTLNAYLKYPLDGPVAWDAAGHADAFSAATTEPGVSG
jgi:transcriptional regulator with PAS, ATPase and Fis domain